MAIQNHSNNKKLKDYIFNYNREVMLSEYVSIPKARLRRLIITEVIAWGIAGFILNGFNPSLIRHMSKGVRHGV
jgi:hypothetical protein